MIRRFNPLYALLPMTVFLGACTTESDESVTPITDPDAGTGFVATYKPDVALMPFPTDVWRSGSTDGTLNIPQFESDPLITHVGQMNMLDGYGLNSAIWADFSDPINEESLVLGETVFVFNVAVAGTPQTTLVPANDLFELSTATFQGGRSVVQLNPVAPLDPLTTYAVFLTAGIEASDGTAASADTAFQAMIDAHNGGGADDLEGDTLPAIFTGMVQSLLTMADNVPTIGGAENVVAAWTFTTQSISQPLDIIQATATAQDSAFVPLLKNPANPADGIYTPGELLLPASDANNDGIPDSGMNAWVFAGLIELPYYLDPESPLTSYWEPVAASCQTAIDADLISEASDSTTVYCPQPATKDTISVPVLVTIPIPAAAGGTCPGIAGVTVFQHGITQNRTNLLPIAGSLATACHAGIAIDLPLHGITDSGSSLYASAESAFNETLETLSAGITNQVTEQTFDLDVDGDGEIDPSGEYFINLESPITARDSLRQAAANLIHVVTSLDAMDVDMTLAGVDLGGGPLGDVGADFDTSVIPVSFVGHSLGGITGTTFLGVNDSVGASVLVAPGGDIADLILNSESIYPEVEAGLAENGLVPGMRFFDEFFRNAQTIIEAGDPINYAAAANADHNILMMEIVGGAGNASDQVVPNSATEKLADAMGLEAVTTTTVVPTGVDGLVQFSAGDHGSLLSPAASLAATTEMQTQMVVYIAGNPLVPLPAGGAVILITDTSVIAP